MTGRDAVWLRRFAGAAGAGQPRVRLVCLPYGGRGASLFRSWPGSLPACVELCAVNLPGREQRIADPPVTDIGQLLEHLTPALAPLLDLPVVLFGHSMGAVVAYRLAVDLKDRFGREPATMVLSSAQAPWAEGYFPTERLAGLSNEELLLEWERWGGPVAEFRKHPELLDLMLPTVRADFELVESVRRLPRPPAPELSCDLLLLAGQDDPQFNPAAAHAWQLATTGQSVQRTFPGGHYFVDTDTASVLEVLSHETALAADRGLNTSRTG